jgi:hypothetical protein
MCPSVLSVVCCQVEASASGLSLVHRSYTECVVSECCSECSTMSRPWPTADCCVMGKKYIILIIMNNKGVSLTCW